MTTPRLPDRIRADLAAAGDPDKAVGQQAYMRSEMPFHGVAAPELRAVLRPHLAAYAPADRATWERDVRDLWDGATHREERYAAIALARHRVARPWQDVAALDLHRHLVVTGAWWDLVDPVATHLVGGVLHAHRPEATPVVRAWAGDDDLWLRRTAVLAQLRHRADDGHRAAGRRGRGQPRRPVVLAAQGHRLGAARARAHRPRLGARPRRSVGRPDLRPVAPRGAQAPVRVRRPRRSPAGPAPA